MGDVYNEIKGLQPHFFSLREIKGNVSLDLKLPFKWKHENIPTLETGKPEPPFSIKIQDEQPGGEKLISLVSIGTEDGYDKVFEYANAVIKTNKEEEEKFDLFNKRVDELKTIFKNSSLDEVKEILNKHTDNYGLSSEQGTGKIELGDNQGSGEDGDTKEKTN